MIDWTKPIRTKSGTKAEFIYRLANPDPQYHQAMVVVIEDERGIQSVEAFSTDGKYFVNALDSDMDLINV